MFSYDRFLISGTNKLLLVETELQRTISQDAGQSKNKEHNVWIVTAPWSELREQRTLFPQQSERVSDSQNGVL